MRMAFSHCDRLEDGHEVERWRTKEEEGSRDDYLFGLWHQCHFSQISKKIKNKKNKKKKLWKSLKQSLSLAKAKTSTFKYM